MNTALAHTRTSQPGVPPCEGPGDTRVLLDLVHRLARRMARRLPASVHLDDLVSAGNEGLVQAMRSFDDSRGVKFTTFARHRIAGAMLDHLQLLDTMSRTGRRQQRVVASCKERLTARLGREPTEAEIADAAGLRIEQYRKCAQRARQSHVVSLQDGRGDSQAPEPADPTPDLETLFVESEIRTRVWAAVEALPPRQRDVMHMYYGQEMTLMQVGAALGVTESRACQLKSQATSLLRAALLH